MITLDPESAAWSRHELAEHEKRLRAIAAGLRRRGTAHLPLRRAADYVASTLERAAADLRQASEAVNKATA